jgi:hypothetical protein
MRNGFFLSLFIVLTLGSSSLKAEQGELMNILQNQPVFELKLDGFGVTYVVELNGVIILNQDNPLGKINTRLPVNHYMTPEDNTLTVSLWSDDDEPINPNANINIKLIVSSHTQPQNEYLIASLNYDNKEQSDKEKIKNSSKSGRIDSHNNFSYDLNGDIIINKILFNKNADDVYQYSRTITIPSSLPLWAFFNSDNLPDYYSMSVDEYYQHMETLLDEYLKVHQAISTNDIKSILPLFKERNEELDLAFYNPVGTLENKIKVALADAANDSTAELLPLTKNKVGFSLDEINKLAKLTRNDEAPAISLNHKDGTGSYSFDMIFRHKDGKWILTR